MSLASFYSQFADFVLVQKAFAGIRVAVVVLILNAVIKMGKKVLKNVTSVILCISSFGLIAFVGISPIYIIILSGFIGVCLSSFLGGRSKS